MNLFLKLIRVGAENEKNFSARYSDSDHGRKRRRTIDRLRTSRSYGNPAPSSVVMRDALLNVTKPVIEEIASDSSRSIVPATDAVPTNTQLPSGHLSASFPGNASEQSQNNPCTEVDIFDWHPNSDTHHILI